MEIASSTMWTGSGNDRAPGNPSACRIRPHENRSSKCKVNIYTYLNESGMYRYALARGDKVLYE